MPVLAFILSPLGRWVAGASVLALVLGLLWADHAHLKAQVAQLAQKAASEHAQAVQQTGQSNAQSDAAKIIDQGRAKADVTVHIQQENRNAILAAPGASDGVDPGLMSALVGGLCRYAGYSSDPACLKLRAVDPGLVPPASSPSSAAGANDWGYSRSARPADGPA